MSDTSSRIWQKLLRAGLVEGEEPLSSSPDSPWYVKSLLALSGWLAASFLYSFFGVALQLLASNGVLAGIVGGGLIWGARLKIRQPDNVFIEHLALATSFAGQAMVVSGLYRLFGGGVLSSFAVGVMEVFLLFVVSHPLHRFSSALFASMAFAATLRNFWMLSYLQISIVALGMALAAWVWLNEFRYPRWGQVMRAAGYALVLTVIVVKALGVFTTYYLAGEMGEEALLFLPLWAPEVPASAVTLYVMWALLRRSAVPASRYLSPTLISVALLVAAFSIKVPGISVGILVMLLGVAGGNRLLSGLGVSTLLAFVGTYYYMLHMTLMEKAQILFALGALLLVLRWLILRVEPGAQEAAHA